MAPAAGGSSARALLLLQIGVRLLTFVLNQLLIRTVNPAVFGAANVQLELVLSVVVSLARDGVRAAILRRQATLSTPATARALHNLALLPIAAGSVLAAAVGGAYLRYMAPPSLWAEGGAALPVSVALYGLGALLELMAEPLHTRALGLPQYVRIRIGMEAGGVLARAMVHVLLLQPACLLWMRVHCAPYLAVPVSEFPWALLAFGLARAAYGAAFLAMACASVAWRTSVRAMAHTLWPTRQEPWFDAPDTRALVRVTTAQAALKLALTEGDKLALTKLTSLAHQGGYALASNYGSILARTLFQPLEESARLQLSQGTDERAKARAATLLQALLRVHVLLGGALVAFGPPLAHAALRIVAGAQWAEPPSPAAPILATYCYYLPVMGVNGLVEAFVQAVAPPHVLAWYSRVLVLSSVAFVAVLYAAQAPVLSKYLGAESAIVWANVTALGVRAGASYRYVVHYFGPTPYRSQVAWSALRPRVRTLGLLVLCAAVLRSSAIQAQSAAVQLGTGVALASVLLVQAWRTCIDALAVLR
ncbi:Oligosaccharide translocation protein rft1 [Malassezia equina]|uniref:Man(5)GlcNAc(2)-PP-dolichol translocation protein RFT1 n=1 Tax=Malassezia equina TaxID=1381935 RepID=A0AAF0EBV7_9BASI|nr:Oligosaccharide translocation protein rft1 [Malassezia equina]